MAGRRPKPPGPPSQPTETELRTKAQFRGFSRYLQRAGARIRDIWETERLDDSEESPLISEVVPLDTFAHWARKGQWRERRDEHWKEVRERVMAHARTEAVQAEIAELGTLESLKGVIMARILGDATQGIQPAMPKSLEGAVTAFVLLDKRISQKRDVVLDASIRAASVDRDEAGNEVQAGRAHRGPLALTDGEVLHQDEIDIMARALAESRLLKRDDDPAGPSEHPADAVGREIGREASRDDTDPG
jgi:hypothetical protein